MAQVRVSSISVYRVASTPVRSYIAAARNLIKARLKDVAEKMDINPVYVSIIERKIGHHKHWNLYYQTMYTMIDECTEPGWVKAMARTLLIAWTEHDAEFTEWRESGVKEFEEWKLAHEQREYTTSETVHQYREQELKDWLKNKNNFELVILEIKDNPNLTDVAKAYQIELIEQAIRKMVASFTE